MKYRFAVEVDVKRTDGPPVGGANLGPLLADALDNDLPRTLYVQRDDADEESEYEIVSSNVALAAS